MAFRRSLVIALSLGTACCVAPKPAPTPRPPAATPTPRPAPAPTPAATYSSWMDVPQTPGDWRWSVAGGNSEARYGSGATSTVFAIRCVANTRSIELVRTGTVTGDAAMTVRSESATRTLAGVPMMDNTGLRAVLSPGDPLLDAMAFSKGRFAIEAPGTAPLYLPSWPEVTRVIEDCR